MFAQREVKQNIIFKLGKIFWTFAMYLGLGSNFTLYVLSPLILTETLFGKPVIPIL